ncbi:hypothetical protein TWF970_001240 [Orbilia oligospora]|uniref:C2H2-type domain-containing protein n=1 Tax=Orbilia oligospora TaxID=2813651 RepID=A0A7C8VC41_ORBOL|nr:hypothetical protein TWF970_001240 [Orbilia oligospora]
MNLETSLQGIEEQQENDTGLLSYGSFLCNASPNYSHEPSILQQSPFTEAEAVQVPLSSDWSRFGHPGNYADTASNAQNFPNGECFGPPLLNQPTLYQDYYSASSMSPDPDVGEYQPGIVSSCQGQPFKESDREYKHDRQRPDLGPNRQRIQCEYPNCGLYYADRSSLLKHRKNKHLSTSMYWAACKYPGCQSQLRGGTEQLAWSNLQTHQRQACKQGTHEPWILHIPKEFRREIRSIPRLQNESVAYSVEGYHKH